MSFPRGGRSCHWRLEGQERGILNVEPVLACSSQSAEGKAILVTFDPRTKDQDTRSLLALTGWTCSLLAVSKCTWSSMNCWTARKEKKKKAVELKCPLAYNNTLPFLTKMESVSVCSGGLTWYIHCVKRSRVYASVLQQSLQGVVPSDRTGWGINQARKMEASGGNKSVKKKKKTKHGGLWHKLVVKYVVFHLNHGRKVTSIRRQNKGGGV